LTAAPFFSIHPDSADDLVLLSREFDAPRLEHAIQSATHTCHYRRGTLFSLLEFQRRHGFAAEFGAVEVRALFFDALHDPALLRFPFGGLRSWTPSECLNERFEAFFDFLLKCFDPQHYGRSASCSFARLDWSRVTMRQLELLQTKDFDRASCGHTAGNLLLASVIECRKLKLQVQELMAINAKYEKEVLTGDKSNAISHDLSEKDSLIVVCIRSVDGRCCGMKVNGKWSCDKLNRMVLDRINGPDGKMSDMHLVCHGRVLHGLEPCADCGIEHGMILNLVAAFRG
jgi:hypothetical protein